MKTDVYVTYSVRMGNKANERSGVREEDGGRPAAGAALDNGIEL